MDDLYIEKLIDLLYPYILERLKKEGVIKSCIKNVNATVSSVPGEQNIGQSVGVKFPYDKTEVFVINKSTSNLSEGDLVCVHYYIDYKNAYIAYKA